jgi:glucokinase
MDSQRPIIALDAGGTKIAGCIAVEGSVIRCREQVPTPVAGGPEAVMAAMIAMALRLHAACPAAAAIGIGSAGIIDPQRGTVVYANENLPGWTGMPIRDRMQQAIPLPVAVDNDVLAMALGEARHGAAAAKKVVLVVALGTGIGGGLVVDGRLFRGATGLAGGLGHIPMNARGPRCPCGNRGCLEAYAAGPRIAQAYAKAAGRTPAPALPEVLMLARNGDAHARAVVARAGRYLGQARAGLINTLNPDATVMGGGVDAAAEDLLNAPFRRSLARHTLAPPLRSVAVLPAALGTDAGLIGAAECARSMLAESPHCAHAQHRF